MGAVLAGSLSAGAAEAQVVIQGGYPPPPPPPQGYVLAQPGYPPPQYGQPVVLAPAGDGPRFRGGIALEGGTLIDSGTNVGAIGPVGQLGVQINNLVGIYAVPGFDILFGPAGGIDLTFAVMADFTILNDQLTLGAGLDSGVFAAFGSGAGLAGAGYGARLHAAWNALVSRGANGVRRRGLVIGLDLRMLVGPEASVSTSGCGAATELGANCNAQASENGFVFSPMLSIGYQAF
jgi:hypothetical protein